MKPAKRTPPKPGKLEDDDFAADKMGRNSLQGDDQTHVHNQRHDQADTNADADDVLGSFEKMDKDVRAEKDLNKGRRHTEEGKKAGGPERGRGR